MMTFLMLTLIFGCEKRKLRDGDYQIVFSHPEALILSKYGTELLLSQMYQKNVVAVVIDEVHCILDWLVSTFNTFLLNRNALTP